MVVKDQKLEVIYAEVKQYSSGPYGKSCEFYEQLIGYKCLFLSLSLVNTERIQLQIIHLLCVSNKQPFVNNDLF